MKTKFWICNLGYYWWSRKPRDPGLSYLKLESNITLDCQEFTVPSDSYDYMIWCTNVVENWDTLIGNWEQFDKLKGLKAWWSFDNHHNASNEIVYADHFDHAFLAHANFLDNYRSIDNCWLPLAVIQFTMDELIDLLPELITRKRTYDLQFRGVDYDFLQNNRKEWLDRWFGQAAECGLKCDYQLKNKTGSVAEYFKLHYKKRSEKWLMSDASICAPVNNDLSTRFFDGMFFGHNIYIPTSVPDVDLLMSKDEQQMMGVYQCEPEKQFIDFYKKHEGHDRLLYLKKALYVLFNHTAIKRVSSAFNQWIGEDVVTLDYDQIVSKVRNKVQGFCSVKDIDVCVDALLPSLENRETYAFSCHKGRYLGDDKSGWNLLQHSRMLLKSGKKKEGKQILKSLLEDNIHVPEAIIDYVDLLIRDGEVEKSINIITESLGKYKYSAASYFRYCDFLMQQGLYSEAGLVLETACKQHHNVTGLFALLASVYRLLGESSKAHTVHERLLEKFLSKLEIEPDRNDIRLSISDVYRYEERFDEALAILSVIEQKAPCFHKLNMKKGQIYEAMGDMDKAKFYYDKEASSL